MRAVLVKTSAASPVGALVFGVVVVVLLKNLVVLGVVPSKDAVVAPLGQCEAEATATAAALTATLLCLQLDDWATMSLLRPLLLLMGSVLEVLCG